MSLSDFEKRKVRTALMLELNSAFSNVSKHYRDHGDDSEREFLQTLIDSVRECIEGKTGETEDL